jgi:hypothetical protein
MVIIRISSPLSLAATFQFENAGSTRTGAIHGPESDHCRPCRSSRLRSFHIGSLSALSNRNRNESAVVAQIICGRPPRARVLSIVLATRSGCGHKSGPFVRRIWPLALMEFADRVPIKIARQSGAVHPIKNFAPGRLQSDQYVTWRQNRVQRGRRLTGPAHSKFC